MITVLNLIYSWPFLIGALVGIAGMKLYQRAYCRHMDKVHPLPHGVHRHPPGISRVWLAGLLTFAVMGYVLLQVTETEEKYRTLAINVAACQQEFNQALIARSAIAAENDRLSVEQRDLLANLDELQGVWLTRLINPPADIADLPPTDQRRQDYGITVTRVYQERAIKVREQVNAITAKQAQLATDRLANPLPEPTCGVFVA